MGREVRAAYSSTEADDELDNDGANGWLVKEFASLLILHCHSDFDVAALRTTEPSHPERRNDVSTQDSLVISTTRK